MGGKGMRIENVPGGISQEDRTGSVKVLRQKLACRV
jgi:hypothetical protein